MKTRWTIGIGSQNPAKQKAVMDGFAQAGYDVHWIPVDAFSGVSEQPFTDEETMQGAINRATAACSGADFGIGLEGGVVETVEGLMLCNWGALVAPGEQPVVAGGARILLPSDVASAVRKGEALGSVMDRFLDQQRSSEKQGAIGTLTNNRITRADMFHHVVQLLIGQWEYRQAGRN